MPFRYSRNFLMNMDTIKMILVGTAIVLITGFTVYLFRDKLFDFSNPIAIKEIQIADTPLILDNVKEMAQLFSSVYYSEIVLDTSRIEKGLIYDTKNQIIIIAGGISHAGTDLSKLNNGNILVTDSTCSVNLPNAEIIRTIANPSEFLIFKEEGKWDHKEVQKLKVICQERLQENAKKSDLIARANKRTISLFTDLLKGLGFKKVSININ
jgi:hypothetical protein